jgi:hypothetical protein
MLDPWFRQTLFASLPPGIAPKDRLVALAGGRAALLRAFVGLEDGSYAQYPARVLPADFDPRRRPWYRMATREEALHWTKPISDRAGETLRLEAVVALRSEGKLLGVAGCDLRVTSLAKELALDLPGFRRAYLVTEDGKLAVREDLEARLLGAAPDPDEELELPPVEDATLAARVAAGEKGGWFVAPNGTLVVFARLVSPQWTYVAELDAAPYLTR